MHKNSSNHPNNKGENISLELDLITKKQAFKTLCELSINDTKINHPNFPEFAILTVLSAFIIKEAVPSDNVRLSISIS